jgi:phosphoglycolate phosphatase (TIGR01487 family)
VTRLARFRPRPPFDRPIRAVVTDIDGTITTPDRRMSMSAQTAIMRLEALGIPVIVASGNVMAAARTVAYMVGATGPIVAENGGLVLYRNDRWEEVIERLGDPTEALRAWERVRERLPDARRLITDRWRETEVAIEEVVGVEAVRRAVEGMPVRVEHTGYAIHITDPRVSKGNGVMRALEVIDVPPEETMAVGDSENDLSVFEVCGLCVAVSRKEERLAAKAQYITRDSGGDGLFEAVSRLLGPP